MRPVFATEWTTYCSNLNTLVKHIPQKNFIEILKVVTVRSFLKICCLTLVLFAQHYNVQGLMCDQFSKLSGMIKSI